MGTVLNAMIQLYKKTYNQVEDIDLCTEWSHVKQASITGISELEKKVRVLVTASKKLSKACAVKRDPKEDRLSVTFSDDAKKIDDYTKTLTGRFESIKKSCADLFVSFGEKDSLSEMMQPS